MNKVFILVLVIALALTACNAVAPTPTDAEPTSIPPTAEVVVVTVEVPVEVTAVPTEAPPTAEPTATLPPEPTATQVPPTEAAPTQAPPTVEVAAVSADTNGPIAVEDSYWGDYFKDINYSNPTFSLRCKPKENVFTATVTDDHIVFVDFYYRIEDKLGTAPSDWKNVGRMIPAGKGTFTLTMSGESVHPDVRKAQAWFDFQLIGLNSQGQVVGRTEKISQLVTYTIDCQ